MNRRGGTHQRAGLHSTILQTAVTSGGPERTRFVQVDLQTPEVRRLKCCCSFHLHYGQSWYLVEPEVVGLQKPLKFGEKPVVVKVIYGLHVTRTVIQITCDLHDSQNRELTPIYAHVNQHTDVCYYIKQSNYGEVAR